ncbi:MAG: NAD(P)-dependent oxidoreductase [Candidatus Woesearchaeota archaeon]
MKLAFFEVEPWQKQYLKKRLKGQDIKFFENELTPKNVTKIKDVEILAVFIYSEINKEILDKLPKLKFIITRSTGFDHVDIKECKSRRIKASNVPYYGENTVAEHALGLMIALSKKLPRAVNQARKGDFDIEGLEGRDIKGKTLGVIGCGHIGQHLLKIAKAMEMKRLVSTRTHKPSLAKKLGFRYVSLNELLKKSDIISLHCPLTEKTRHLINMKNIKHIKKGAFLVNTARGGLIQTNALIYALDKEILAGAALDVLEEEEDLKQERHLSTRKLSKQERKILKQNHQLLKDRDVLITPHTAFYTREAMQRILDTTIENIRSSGRKNRIV